MERKALNERKEVIKRNCEIIISQIRTSPTDRIKLFMKSFINMRMLLEEALIESLENEGKTEDEIILILNKVSGRSKWIAQMEEIMLKQDADAEKDNKDNYLSRINH